MENNNCYACMFNTSEEHASTALLTLAFVMNDPVNAPRRIVDSLCPTHKLQMAVFGPGVDAAVKHLSEAADA